ncbi:hypothetical protein [Luteimonas sp. e5]
MNERELQELALRLGAFTQALEERAARISGELERTGESMAKSAQDIESRMQRLSHDVIDTVRREGRGAVSQGLQEGMAPGIERLQQTVGSLHQASQTLHEQVKGLQASQRSIGMLAGAALIIGALLAAGGSSYLVWKNHQELKRAEFSRQILDASRSGSLSQCGERLCVRVGPEAKRFDANADYILVD